MKRLKWSAEEKKIVDDTFDRFKKMTMVQIFVVKCSNEDKSNFHEQNYYNNSNRMNPFRELRNNTNDSNNWRKQQRNSSKN